VLLHGHRVLGQERGDDAALALAVAAAGIESHASDGRPWPCGIDGGETSGLMLGLSGIGYFYLRLYKSAVPSILLPQNEIVLARQPARV
jgi:lantibiotic biosynthesis protein